MRDDVAISVQNVTMSFNLNKEKVDNLKEYVIKLISHKLEYKKFYALQNISFDVKKESIWLSLALTEQARVLCSKL